MFYVIVTRHVVGHVRSHSANYEPMVANEHMPLAASYKRRWWGITSETAQ